MNNALSAGRHHTPQPCTGLHWVPVDTEQQDLHIEEVPCFGGPIGEMVSQHLKSARAGVEVGADRH